MSEKLIKISSATYLKDYTLLLNFIDGKVNTINFYNFLNESTNPEIRLYLNLDKFKTFEIKDGELIWGDFALLFPIQELYDGKISA